MQKHSHLHDVNGIIYIVENKINGKHYVGQTTQKWPIRKNQHIKHPLSYSALDQAIQKYGSENFIWEIIDYNSNREILNQLERLHISRYESMTTEWGYNIKEGGLNGAHSKESLLKQGNSLRGIKRSPEFCKRISERQKGEKNWFYGKNFSKEHRKKISKANMGKSHSLQSRKRMSIAKEGKYPGTYFVKGRNPENKCWFSHIHFNGKNNSLGYFIEPITGSIIYKFVRNEIFNYLEGLNAKESVTA